MRTLAACLCAAAGLVLVPAAAPAQPGALAYSDEDGSLYLATLQGTSPQTLFEADNSTSLAALAISPDGKQVLALDTGDDDELVLVPTAGGQPAPIDGTDGADAGSFSPDGKTVVFSIGQYSTGDLDAGLYTVQLGGQSAAPKQVVTTPGSADDSLPEYSPDGTKLAFTRDTFDTRSAETVTLELAPAAGGAVKPLTTGAVPDAFDGGALSFSPDGTTIAYAGDYDDPGIWTVPVAGGNPTQLTSDYDYWPAFASDGSKVYFSRDSGSDNASDLTAADVYELWTVKKDGTGAALVIEGDFEDLAVGTLAGTGGGGPTTSTPSTTNGTGTTQPTPTTTTTAAPATTTTATQPASHATAKKPKATGITVTAKPPRYVVRWHGKAPAWKVTLRVGKDTATARVKGAIHSHTFVLHNAGGAHSARVTAV